MNKTAIDWCDMTWNPVTGCLHGCTYCYARKIAKRFGLMEIGPKKEIHVLSEPVMYSSDFKTPNGITRDSKDDTKSPYPYGFTPTFHRYRLDEPANKKKPQNIFVCSMADLFGEWVPDEWIETIYQACENASWHRYLFLTKSPAWIWRDSVQLLKDAWYGTTVTTEKELKRIASLPLGSNRFISIEPILERIELSKRPIQSAIPFSDWVIIGAENGTRKGKTTPKREWIENIVNYCHDKNVPVFMKSSLANIWGEPLIQEYPWGNG